MSLHIAVIFTGGTIGSAVTGGIVDVDASTSSLLIAQYRAACPGGEIFEEYRPVNVLSENMTPGTFGKIAAEIRKVLLRGGVDGIIVTHGTDTLTFSANALSVIFADAAVPVVLVSADAPLSEPGSNGAANFRAAVEFIRTGIPGVFVAYRNAGEPAKIHLGSRLQESEQLTGKVSSPADLCFGRFEGDAFVRNPAPGNPSAEELAAPRKPSGLQELCSDVVTIVPHTALDFDFYLNESRIPRAFVIRLYHSGTACGAEGKFGVADFVSRAERLGAQVILSPVNSALNAYASTAGWSGRVLSVRDTTFEMTVAKVMLALGSGQDIGRVLGSNYAFERICLREK